MQTSKSLCEGLDLADARPNVGRVRVRLVAAVAALAVFGGGLLAGAFSFERTKTKVVVQTRTVTEQATSDGQTLRVEIIDYTPQVASGGSLGPRNAGLCGPRCAG